jgi:hypothetical protein
MLAMVLMATRMQLTSATTLEEQLTTSYSSCYSSSGEGCTCTGGIALSDESLTGTIPSALSACADITVLCVAATCLGAIRFLSVTAFPPVQEIRRQSSDGHNSSRVERSN